MKKICCEKFWFPILEHQASLRVWFFLFTFILRLTVFVEPEIVLVLSPITVTPRNEPRMANFAGKLEFD